MTQTVETAAKSSFKLNVKQKNWLVSGHVASGAIWLGTGLCLVIMGVKNVNAPNGDALYAINEICKFLDDFVIVPTATLSLVTGFFLSWFTNWGFVKHYWVSNCPRSRASKGFQPLKMLKSRKSWHESR